MGGEQHRDAALLGEPLQQLEDLRLDGDVERGGRLVGDDEVGLRHQRHGDHQALALAAGELVRQLGEAPARDRGSAPSRSISMAAAAIGLAARARIAAEAARRGRARSGARRGDFHFISSMIWSPMRNSGLNEPYGSCGMKVMRRPRTSRRRGGAAWPSRSSPSKRIAPPRGARWAAGCRGWRAPAWSCRNRTRRPAP